MFALQIRDEWSIDHLKLVEIPEPEPGRGEVKLRIKAAALNYRDLLVPERGYGARTGELPLIPISDGVGEVVAVGDGVTRVQVGDRVCPLFFQTWFSGPASAEKLEGGLGGPLDGVMAEFRVFPEAGVARVPAHLADEEAASLPCAALTAWSALVTEGSIRAGDTVLIQGTGGVSLFALQFAKTSGARAIVLSSSEAKLDRARALGADQCINYRVHPDWSHEVRRLTGGAGVDHVVEVGGAKTLPHSLRSVRPGGTLSVIGVLSGGSLDARLGLIVTRQIRLQGITVGHRDGFEAMARAIGQHGIRPVIDRVFPFAELRAALDHLRSGAHLGKVCLRHAEKG